MPISFCRRTTSATDDVSFAASAGSSLLPHASMRSSGRGRLPAWLVRIWSELVFTVPPLTPELARGERSTLDQRFELCPGDLRMDAAAETAIGRGDDPLPADQVGKTKDALGDEVGVLDDIGGVADNAGQDHLVVRQLVLPDLPLVLV